MNHQFIYKFVSPEAMKITAEAPKKTHETSRDRVKKINNYLRKKLGKEIKKGESYTKTPRLQAEYLEDIAEKQRKNLTDKEKGVLDNIKLYNKESSWEFKYSNNTLWDTLTTAYKKLGIKNKALRGKLTNSTLAEIANGNGIKLISDKAKEKVKTEDGYHNIWKMPLAKLGIAKFKYNSEKGNLVAIDKKNNEILSFDTFVQPVMFHYQFEEEESTV